MPYIDHICICHSPLQQDISTEAAIDDSFTFLQHQPSTFPNGGDGTTVSRSVYLVVIPFVIHNETFASSSNDCKESYEYIAECITDLLTEMESLKESLNSLQVGDYTYNFNYFLGADMKFLMMVLGIEAPNST